MQIKIKLCGFDVDNRDNKRYQRIFYENSEEVEVDVFKKLEKRKVLSNVEKSGLLSKAEELGFTLSSIEKLGTGFAESVGENSKCFAVYIGFCGAAHIGAAVVAIVVIPDDSAGLIAARLCWQGPLGWCGRLCCRNFTANSIEGSLVLGKLEGNSELRTLPHQSLPANDKPLIKDLEARALLPVEAAPISFFKLVVCDWNLPYAFGIVKTLLNQSCISSIRWVTSLKPRYRYFIFETIDIPTTLEEYDSFFSC
uniref:Uncharacterized protein n=1 Tax=Salix viminalis TaxID=40686 RepID=A0A6N2LG63_SALVM